MKINNFRHLVGQCWVEHAHFAASVACGIAMGVLFSTRIATYQARMVPVQQAVRQYSVAPPSPTPPVPQATTQVEPETEVLVFQPETPVLSVRMPTTANSVKKGIPRTVVQDIAPVASSVAVAPLAASSVASQPKVVQQQPKTERVAASSESSASASSENASSSSVQPAPNEHEQETPQAQVASSSSTVSQEVQNDDSFPAFGRTVHPVSRVPNWGAMSTPAEWKRTYGQMTEADWVPVPAYDLHKLTIPLKSLTSGSVVNDEDVPIVTAKLYYSTRYMGKYDLDAGEHTGNHAGVDLKLPLGTPIGAIAGGRVHTVRNDSRLGLYVVIEHRNESGQFFSIYAHLDSAKVSAGDAVKPGQTIGFVGLTGMTTLAHLHLEVHRGASATPDGLHASAFEASAPINPMTFIAANGKSAK